MGVGERGKAHKRGVEKVGMMMKQQIPQKSTEVNRLEMGFLIIRESFAYLLFTDSLMICYFTIIDRPTIREETKMERRDSLLEYS